MYLFICKHRHPGKISVQSAKDHYWSTVVCAKYGDTTRLACSPSDKKCATTVSPTATGLITPTGWLNLCSKDLPPKSSA